MQAADTGKLLVAFTGVQTRRLLPILCAALFGAAGCDVPRTHLAATRWTGSDGAAAGDVNAPDGSVVQGCLESRVDLTRPTGTVVLIVDRSSAMNTLNDGTCAACGTYSTTLARTVETLTTATSNRFRWGLELFPSPTDPTGCLITPGLDLPPMTDPHLALAAALAAAPPSGGAPVAAAVQQASGYLNGLGGKEPKLMLLATAGAPTCAAKDPAQDDLSAAVAAVDDAPQFAFVLGFGPERARFDKLADVGATGSAYSADQSTSLLHDIEDLARSLASCVYPVPGGPLGDGSVTVLLDGAPLTAGGTDGFSVSTDGANVRLRGSACFYLSAHASLVIRVGCSD